MTVSITGLTIANGKLTNGNGGGILNNGFLALNNCNVYGNSAASGSGIYNDAVLTMNNCNIGGIGAGQPNIGEGIRHNGGSGGVQQNIFQLTMNGGSISGNETGIDIFAPTTLDGVSIVRNTGGGVFIAVPNGRVTKLLNCLIANNTNPVSGGFGGGGIGNQSTGPVFVINSTISGNSTAGLGGGIRNLTSITLTNVTLTNNRATSSGGGISVAGTVLARNTIIAGNFRGAGSTADDLDGAISSNSIFNLIGTGGSGGLTNGVEGNQTGVANPGLGILAANGGPTLTHALLPGSPAINAGSNNQAQDNGTFLTTDQRGAGFNRIVNGTVDVGAFESPAAGINPIDQPDLFVRQHYLDFLSRVPDQSGWDFWTNQITSCGANAQCIETQRINVSASFFLSIEFQQTGYLVERMFKVAYGNATGNSTFNGAHQLSVPSVRFTEFLQGTQRIGQGVIVLQPGWEQLIENNKQAYALEFVQTSRFITAFPTTMTPTEFVDKLNANAGNVLSAAERTTAITLFSGAGDSSNTTARAQALRQVAEDIDLYNSEYNRAFVLAEYYGYLRRNPNDAPESTLDYTGYDFWLTKLNQFNGNYINAEMVKAFLSSIEYRQRFGQ